MDLIQKACNLGFNLKNKEYYLWELQKWLREEHSIDVLVDKGFLSNKYSYEVLYKNDMLDSEYVFKTYEEALGKGLYEALKLI